MSGYAVVDVAVGLSFVFLILSTFATAAVEAIAGKLKKRASSLESWLAGNIAGDDGSSSTGKDLANKVLNHPLIRAMTKGTSKPSYIPAENFVIALLESASADVVAGKKYARIVASDAKTVTTDAKKLIDDLPDGPLKEVVDRLWGEAGGDLSKFRKASEVWFNQAMDRLSGWYKRWSQVWLWLIGLVLAAALNVDAIRIAETLWHDQTVRQLVVEQAHKVPATSINVKDAGTDLNNLPLPIGWGGPAGHWPHGILDYLLKALGILITSAAVSLGAPFWFDALSKIANIRNSGPKPSTTPTGASPTPEAPATE
jgi:hypothetical protein